MPEMHIQWTIERMDDYEEPNPTEGECLIQIEGKIECDGQAAGLVEGFYLFAQSPESPGAFMEFWDLDGGTCDVFEEIIAPGHRKFLEPLPKLLEIEEGILGVYFIALRPQYRHLGLGREVMRELVRNFADPRVGVVLLDARPLQHRPHGYDDFDEEVRDLPWNSPDEDQSSLMRHFHSWGMKHLPRTRFMFATPQDLIGDTAADWYPGLLYDPDEDLDEE